MIVRSFVFCFKASCKLLISTCFFARVDSLSAENIIPDLLSSPISMENLHDRLTFDLDRKSKIFYYSQKEDPKISRIAEFGGEML